MSCNTNDRPIDIPLSISISKPSETLVRNTMETVSATGDVNGPDVPSEGKATGSVVENGEISNQLSVAMPSSNVVEISQTFYWPLYSKPIDWVYQRSNTGSMTEDNMMERCRRVAELLHSLEFIQPLESEEFLGVNNEGASLIDNQCSSGSIVASSPSGDTISRIMEELEEEKEDWFNDLSGGQRSKVELVRKVFLMDVCPDVLLIDETMAPLDPRSKSLVMARIKDFCAGSVVIVIYHTDVESEKEEDGAMVGCVPSNDFFDGNIHVENKMMDLRPLC